jgi:hypothetical protein
LFSGKRDLCSLLINEVFDDTHSNSLRTGSNALERRKERAPKEQRGITEKEQRNSEEEDRDNCFDQKQLSLQKKKKKRKGHPWIIMIFSCSVAWDAFPEPVVE